jgi:hypothetical protein
MLRVRWFEYRFEATLVYCFRRLLGLYPATAVPGDARYLILSVVVFDIDEILPSLEGVLKNDTTIDEATLQRSTELQSHNGILATLQVTKSRNNRPLRARLC